MMFVVLHHVSAYGKPVGIWWWDGAREVPTSYYLPDSENFYARAVDTLGSAKDRFQWQQIAQKLADRTPWGDNYEATKIDGDPKVYLRAVRRVKV